MIDDQDGGRLGCDPECARPRAEQGGMGGGLEPFIASGTSDVAAPEDGRTTEMEIALLPTTVLPGRPSGIAEPPPTSHPPLFPIASTGQPSIASLHWASSSGDCG